MLSCRYTYRVHTTIVDGFFRTENGPRIPFFGQRLLHMEVLMRIFSGLLLGLFAALAMCGCAVSAFEGLSAYTNATAITHQIYAAIWFCVAGLFFVSMTVSVAAMAQISNG